MKIYRKIIIFKKIFALKLYKEFISFSTTLTNTAENQSLLANIQVKRQIKWVENINICYNMFSPKNYFRNSSLENAKIKKNEYIISSLFHFYTYVVLFNIWCLAKICNQISHIWDSVSFNDSRLSDIMSLVIDIYHTVYTAIPLFFPLNKWWEETMKRMGNAKFTKDDEYVFAFFSVYILLIFIFIIFQRLMLLEKEEMKAWMKFIKLLFILNLIWLIFRDYMIMAIVKLGVPNCLLLMNIVWNIISRKAVTEVWITFLIKILLTIISPIISISNYRWQWSNIKDFIKYFAYFRISMIDFKEGEYAKLVVQTHQSLFLQIIMICILLFQKKYGSLFFLPSWLRTKVYENMSRDIRKMSQTEVERSWIFWTNSLWQTELVYSDNWKETQNNCQVRYLFETKCGFIYHQKWFYKSLTIFPNCHHCGCRIPDDGWDD